MLDYKTGGDSWVVFNNVVILTNHLSVSNNSESFDIAKKEKEKKSKLLLYSSQSCNTTGIENNAANLFDAYSALIT